jgi:parvulin-like peptidyl-prolyl isomerase
MTQGSSGPRWSALVALCAALCLADAAPAADSTGQTGADGAVFARVNGTPITVERYEEELHLAYRQKFYHGRPPEEKMAQLRREVGDTLIDRELLLAEAERRGIQPDEDKSQKALAAFAARYGENPQWQQRRAALLPVLMRGLREQTILERLEHAVREVPPAGSEQARQYFDAHPDAFMEPERVRLSVILMKVDPGAAQAQWDKAREQAQSIHQQLVEGADFATLARERSGDSSAASGGDMGYVHRGMLPEALHAQLDRMVAGTLSEPLVLLEGVALFRLEERRPPSLKSFDDSKARAAGLWQRERSERQWRGLKLALRSAATIEVIDLARYPSAGADKR